MSAPRLSEQGVAILLLQGACRTCISSVASIFQCLVGVAVSRMSRSVSASACKNVR